jgi:hypothetical protein
LEGVVKNEKLSLKAMMDIIRFLIVYYSLENIIAFFNIYVLKEFFSFLIYFIFDIFLMNDLFYFWDFKYFRIFIFFQIFFIFYFANLIFKIEFSCVLSQSYISKLSAKINKVFVLKEKNCFITLGKKVCVNGDKRRNKNIFQY